MTSSTSSCASSPARSCPPTRAESRSRSATASTSTTSRSARRSRTSRCPTRRSTRSSSESSPPTRRCPNRRPDRSDMARPRPRAGRSVHDSTEPMTTFPARLPHRALAVLLSFAAALVAFVALRGAEPPSPRADGRAVAPAASRPAGSTDAEIARLQAVVRDAPRETAARVQLAGAYLEKVRETGDAAFHARADGLLREALAARPGDPDALVASAGVALSRHDFLRGLALARRARAARPAALAPYPPLVDALVELGRFDAAERTLQRLVDAEPGLAAYARVSYVRELHGDLDGAARAMRRAIGAGGPARQSVANVQSLLGTLELARGRPAHADAAHRAALAALPGYPAAEAGRARAAAAQGDLSGAIRR